MIFRLRFEQAGGHIHCRLFQAAAPDHTWQKNGDLVFDEPGWLVFATKMKGRIEMLPEDDTTVQGAERTMTGDGRTRPHYFMRDEAGNPVPCDDLLEWALWFETADHTLCRSEDEGPEPSEIVISTIFLGLDYALTDSGPPILWETLVFGGPLDGEMERYTSKEAAVAGHQAMCARVAAARLNP